MALWNCRLGCQKRCPLVQNGIGILIRYRCPDSVEKKAYSSEPWCRPCPVCKENWVNSSPCLQRRQRKYWRQKQVSGLLKKGGRSLRQVQDASATPILNNHMGSTGSSTTPSVAVIKHPVLPSGQFANGRDWTPSATPSSSVPAWAIAVAVVCPVLAMVTVTIVWHLRKSLARKS